MAARSSVESRRSLVGNQRCFDSLQQALGIDQLLAQSASVAILIRLAERVLEHPGDLAIGQP